MTILSRGPIFQPVPLVCTYHNGTVIQLQKKIDSTDFPSKFVMSIFLITEKMDITDFSSKFVMATVSVMLSLQIKLSVSSSRSRLRSQQHLSDALESAPPYRLRLMLSQSSSFLPRFSVSQTSSIARLFSSLVCPGPSG